MVDIVQLQNVLTLAGLAATSTGSAVGAANQIKALFTKRSGTITAEEESLLNSLAEQLIGANMMNVQLSGLLKNIHQDLQRDDAFESNKARYELYHTSEDDVVFKLKPEHTNGGLIHYICPVCLQRDRVFSFVTGGREYKHCQTCAHVYSFETPRDSYESRKGYV